MSPTLRFLALALVLAILAGAFFTLGRGGSDEGTEFPPHSVQQ